MPQVEVKFDIDANGILSVTATGVLAVSSYKQCRWLCLCESTTLHIVANDTMVIIESPIAFRVKQILFLNLWDPNSQLSESTKHAAKHAAIMQILLLGPPMPGRQGTLSD